MVGSRRRCPTSGKWATAEDGPLVCSDDPRIIADVWGKCYTPFPPGLFCFSKHLVRLRKQKVRTKNQKWKFNKRSRYYTQNASAESDFCECFCRVHIHEHVPCWLASIVLLTKCEQLHAKTRKETFAAWYFKWICSLDSAVSPRSGSAANWAGVTAVEGE